MQEKENTGTRFPLISQSLIMTSASAISVNPIARPVPLLVEFAKATSGGPCLSIALQEV